MAVTLKEIHNKFSVQFFGDSMVCLC